MTIKKNRIKNTEKVKFMTVKINNYTKEYMMLVFVVIKLRLLRKCACKVPD